MTKQDLIRILDVLTKSGIGLVCFKDLVNGRNPLEINCRELYDGLAPIDVSFEDFQAIFLKYVKDGRFDSQMLNEFRPSLPTKIVNIFGPPGAGKTTTAAELFVLYKKEGRRVSQIQEYATYLINSGRLRELIEEQGLIFEKQSHAQEISLGKFEYAITESPLVMSSFYAQNRPDLYSKLFHESVFDKMTKFDNLNFYVYKKNWDDYDVSGRIHTKEEAQAMEGELLGYLRSKGLEVVEVPRNVEPAIWIKGWLDSQFKKEFFNG